MTPVALTRLVYSWAGSSQGTKSGYLRQLFPDIMMKLEALLASTSNLILIGSSLGGLMAAIYTCQYAARMQPLILLVPVLANDAFVPFHDCRIEVPTRGYHGTEDDVVPIEPVRAVVSKTRILSKACNPLRWGVMGTSTRTSWSPACRMRR